MNEKIYANVDGETSIICLIGNPVAHSLSPQIQNTISKVMDKNIVYINFRVDPQNLGAAVNGLRALNVKGFNITIPYKEKVIEYLDEVTEDAMEIGAVNTVKNINGKLVGYNTDWSGYYNSLIHNTGEGCNGKKVLILGAGGAAKAIAISCLKNKCDKLQVFNRTLEKSQEFVNNLNERYNQRVSLCCNEDIMDSIKQTDLIINTTSAGMHPNVDQMPVDENSPFRKGLIVSDIIYNPVVTKLMVKAYEKGANTFNGFEMLFQQAIGAWEIWNDMKINEDNISEIRKILRSTII